MKLEELANSIRSKGLLQPVVVRPSSEGYELVAGERRLRAAAQAGLKEIPVLIREFTDEEAAEIAIVENLQREDLNPIEKAKAFRRLMEDFALTQEQVSERVGGDRSTIANFLRLLQLPDEVQDIVSRGTLSMGHARTLVTVPDRARQIDLAKEAVARGCSVRDLERMVRLDRKPKKGTRNRIAAGAQASSPDEQALLNRAQRHLGTRVRLRHTGRGGEILIEFYSDADLDRILRQMGVLPGITQGSPI